MTAAFTPARADGRSDRRVVYELVADNDPDSKVTYETLIDALQDGLDAPVDRPRVYAAVSQANTTLLREKSRYLSVVRGEGYRIIRADEHMGVALGKKQRAEKSIRRGVQVLRNVRMDELTQPQQAAHQGQLLIIGGMLQMMHESERRHERSDSLIADLKQRVTNLEGKTGTGETA
jgi:hypothetical protein